MPKKIQKKRIIIEGEKMNCSHEEKMEIAEERNGIDSNLNNELFEFFQQFHERILFGSTTVKTQHFVLHRQKDGQSTPVPENRHASQRA